MLGVARPQVAANRRESGRKSELAAMRRAGDVPGSLYGKATITVAVQVKATTISTYLNAHGSGALLDLVVDGESIPVVLHEVERDAVTRAVTHVGFHRITLGDSLHASIPLRFKGADSLIKIGLVLQTQLDAVELKGRADQLPEVLEVDVRGYVAGDIVHLSDIPLPEGIELARDGNRPAAIVTGPRASSDPRGEVAS